MLQLVVRFYEAEKASGLSPASRLSLAEALAGPVGAVLLAALEQTWRKRGALRVIPETCTQSQHLRVMWVLDVGVQLAMTMRWPACGTTRWTSHAALLWTWLAVVGQASCTCSWHGLSMPSTCAYMTPPAKSSSCTASSQEARALSYMQLQAPAASLGRYVQH